MQDALPPAGSGCGAEQNTPPPLFRGQNMESKIQIHKHPGLSLSLSLILRHGPRKHNAAGLGKWVMPQGERPAFIQKGWALLLCEPFSSLGPGSLQTFALLGVKVSHTQSRESKGRC